MTEPVPREALGSLPVGLRNDLLEAFGSIVTNYAQGRWEPSELNGGKLCETVYTIVRGRADGQYPAQAQKPRNMVDACRALEKETAQPRSVRIQIPRFLIALYEVRNNRGVGHVGGDIDPNHMDALLVLECSKWLMAELVRIFHNLDVTTATEVVDALVDRTVPIIWRVGDEVRVLDPAMTQREKTLMLLYSTAGSVVGEDRIVSWVEARNPSAYRRNVLRVLHSERLLEYDQEARTVCISPLGVKYVESNFSLTVG